MRQRRVVHDVQLAASQADIIGWQEIRPRRYKRAVRSLDGFATHFPAKGSAEPISWRTKVWERVEAGGEILHPGRALVCHTRHIAWVLLRHRKSGRLVLVHNTHYAPARRGKPMQSVAADLQAMGRRNHRAFLAEWVAKGVPTIGLGDYNQRHHPFGRRFLYARVLHPVHPGIDHVVLTDGLGHRWRVRSFNTARGRFSDHQGRRVRAVLREQ